MVKVTFNENGSLTYDNRAFYQYDFGQYIEIHGLSLPPTVQIHFARKHNPAIIEIGDTADNITIVHVPAEILEYPGEFNVYIFVADETSGKTVKTITFYTREREKPVDYASPDEPNVVQQLMNRLNKIIETGIGDYEPNIDTVNGMIDVYVKQNMLANNLVTNQAGLLALDAAQGKALYEGYTSADQVIQNQVNTLNNNLTVQTSSLTADSNVALSYVRLSKYGKVVNISFYATYTGSENIFKVYIPVEYRPVINMYFSSYVFGASAIKDVTYTYVLQSGEINIVKVDGAEGYCVTFSYIVS